MLICWIYQFTIRYIYHKEVINGARYDMELVTASDYTVAGQISKR